MEVLPSGDVRLSVGTIAKLLLPAMDEPPLRPHAESAAEVSAIAQVTRCLALLMHIECTRLWLYIWQPFGGGAPRLRCCEYRIVCQLLVPSSAMIWCCTTGSTCNW